MKTTIYYFTGTGNSLWAAKTIGNALPDSTLIPILRHTEISNEESEITGIVAPVYAWGTPLIVEELIKTLDYKRCGYLFVVSVNAGGVAGTNIAIKKMVAARGGALSAGFSLPLVSNYILFGNPPSQEKIDNIIDNGRKKLENIISSIKARKTDILEKDGAFKNLILGAINKTFRSQMKKADKKFTTDEKCNGCGICSKICPAENITVENGRPVWHQRCEQCLACMHWCPETSINSGAGTKGKKRYHHPEVTLYDLLRRNA